MSKKLYINTGSAIILNDKQNILGNYEKILMNTGSLIISNRVLADLREKNVHFTYNSGSTMFIDVDGEILVLNGKTVIDENSEVADKVIVSDSIIVVAPAAKDMIAKVKGVYAKKIFLPRNINLGLIPNLNVEKITTYDSDAEIIFGDKDIDENSVKNFLPNKKYYIDGTVTIFNKNGADYLKNNIIKIECKSLKIYEDIFNVLSDFLKTEKIEIIPEGYKCLNNGNFDETTIYQYGKKLYVDGNLKIDKKFKDELKKFESITVSGKLTIEKTILEDFFKIGTAGSVDVYEGKFVLINGKINLSHEFFAPFIEQNNKITLKINGKININDDVVREDISCISKLTVNGNIKCNNTIKAYLIDVLDGNYSFSNDNEDDKMNDIISAFDDPNNEVINTGSYLLI